MNWSELTRKIFHFRGNSAATMLIFCDRDVDLFMISLPGPVFIV
jgi:hypothetical protein